MNKVLRTGSSGPYVLWTRETLQRCGALSGDVRWDYEDRWEDCLDAAVRAWQGAHGLVVDGIVGPKTWASLEQAHAKLPGRDPWAYYPEVAQRIKIATPLRNAAVIEVTVWAWLAARYPQMPRKHQDRLIAGVISSAYSESRLDAGARNPRSSARGLFQVMASYWDLRPTEAERLDPWRCTDLILYGFGRMRSSRRDAILRAAELERGAIEAVTYLWCRYVEAASDRDTPMEWRRKIARAMWREEEFR